MRVELGSVYMSIEAYNNLVTDRLNLELKYNNLVNQVMSILTEEDTYDFVQVRKLKDLFGMGEEVKEQVTENE